MRRIQKTAVKNGEITEDLLRSSHGRLAAIRHYSSMGFQKNPTPSSITKKIVDCIEDLEGKTFRVLFNLEFLEELLERGVDMSKVQFVADTPEERRFARLVYKVETVLAGEHTWKRILKHKRASELLERVMAKRRVPLNKAADITLSNPPYNRGIDLKIIMAMNSAGLLKRLVCVHPSTWLVETKGSSPTIAQFNESVVGRIRSLNMFNGNPVFGIRIFVPCVISDFDMERKGTSIKVSFLGSEEYSECLSTKDVTMHGRDWDPVVKELFNRVSNYIGAHGSVWDKFKNNKTNKFKNEFNKPVFQIPMGRGDEDKVSKDKTVKDTFYTVSSNDLENEVFKKNHSSQVAFTGGVYYLFDTVQERNNFSDYTRTDFFRICLSLSKINKNLCYGELVTSPWLDFTRSWTDDELFTHFGYPKGHPIREYAKRFLPDYHNLYPNGKDY
jgi:hypothetical protein